MKNQLGLLNFLIVVLATAFLAGCDSGPNSHSSSLSSTSPTPIPTPSSSTETDITAPANVPLYLTIGARWEDTTVWEDIGQCTVSASAVSPSTTNCTLSVEEARLYFSDIRFTVGTNLSSLCEIVTFRPYYYLRSNSAAYIPLGETTSVDCTATPIPLACYGGAGPSMIENFPEDTGKYFLSNLTTWSRYTISSENTLRTYAGDWVNYLITNDISDPTLTSNAGDSWDYVGNSLRNYAVKCMDRHGFVHHTLNLLFQDEDKSGAEDDPEDEFTDWF